MKIILTKEELELQDDFAAIGKMFTDEQIKEEFRKLKNEIPKREAIEKELREAFAGDELSSSELEEEIESKLLSKKIMILCFFV